MNEFPDINILFGGSTYISKINGITAAGATEELTFLTPPIDMEILEEGRAKSIDAPPTTPDGIPSPSIVTKACLDMINTNSISVNAGLLFKPKSPFIETWLVPALDGSESIALPQMSRAVEIGKMLGRQYLTKGRKIMISESVPGGTTTAQAVLNLLGLDIKASSSMKNNPQNIKDNVIKKMIQRHGIQNDPLKSVNRVGDYMQSIVLGFLCENDGASVIMAGGTQMAAIYYMASELNFPMEDVQVWTTDMVMKESADTLNQLVPKENIKFSSVNFSNSTHVGLRKYQEGHVREGAGMGASLLLAKSKHSESEVWNSVDKMYNSVCSE
jgi:uncharacterized protein (TIGR00303 family)